MARTFWKGVTNLLGLAAAPAVEPIPEKENPGFFSGDEVDLMSLESMLSEQSARYGGIVHIISLAEFHLGVGDKWARLAPKVTLITEGIIQRHIGPGNLFRAYLGDTYFLLFRTVDYTEGQKRLQVIINELGSRLVGAAFIGAEATRVGVGETNALELLAEDGKINTATMLALIKPCEMVTEKSLPPAEQNETKEKKTDTDRDPLPGAFFTTAAIVGRADKKAQNQNWTQQNHVQLKHPEASMVAIERPKSSSSLESQWVPLNRPKAEPETTSVSESRFSVIFRPTWNALSQAVDVHLCLPCMKDGKMTRTGEVVFASAGGAAGVVRLDGLVIRSALQALIALNNARSKGTLIVPIHYGSLGRPMWPSLLPLFLDCPEAIRLLGLTIELIDIPTKAFAEEISGRIELIRPYCRGILIRTNLHTPRLGEFIKLMPDGFSVNITDVSRDASTEPYTEETLAQALTELRQAASDMPFCLWGARKRQEALLALEAGFSCINGSTLMTDLPEPKKSLPVSTTLFRKIATPASSRINAPKI